MQCHTFHQAVNNDNCFQKRICLASTVNSKLIATELVSCILISDIFFYSVFLKSYIIYIPFLSIYKNCNNKSMQELLNLQYFKIGYFLVNFYQVFVNSSWTLYFSDNNLTSWHVRYIFRPLNCSIDQNKRLCSTIYIHTLILLFAHCTL